MRIIADENIPMVEEFFADLGEVVRLPGRSMTAEDLRGADALLVRSVTKVNQALLAESQVRFVGTCTIGVDHLDRDYLESAGITWASAPGCNANSVVEYVYAALAHLDIDWLEQRVGIIGCGNVGGLLHKRLRAQGVECHCYDPFLDLEHDPDLTKLESVLDWDIVCLHTPYTTDGPHPTHHLIGKKELARLRPGALLLNGGRGPVVDNTALLEHLESGASLQVVLDVWEPEPEISRSLLQLVDLGSPHIAGYSYDGKVTGTEMIYQALCQHLGQEPSKRLSEQLPALDNDQCLIRANDPWLALRNAVEQVYAIAADDRRLRALAQRADAGEESFGNGFDALRKHYPVRREFNNYRLVFEPEVELQARAKITERLVPLGFRAD